MREVLFAVDVLRGARGPVTSWTTLAALLLALHGVVQSVALWRLAERVHELEEQLGGRVTVPEWEAIGGTGNIHRRKLGWKVRVVLWWVALRERIARWIGGK